MTAMPSLAEYALDEGYIRNWLVAGPRTLAKGTAATPPDYHSPAMEASALELAGETLAWRYLRCAEDRLLDVSAATCSTDRLETWAACRLVAEAPQQVVATLRAPAMVDLWANAEPIASSPSAGETRIYCFDLPAGVSPLTVRFERPAGAGEPNALRLRLEAAGRAPLAVRVAIPIATALPQDRALYEAALDELYLERSVFPRGAQIGLHWARPQPSGLVFTARFQTPEGLIFAEAFDVRPTNRRQIETPANVPDGPYQVLLLPDTRQFHHEKRLRVSRALPLWMASPDFIQSPAGDYEARRQQALTHAARQRGDLYAEFAKMALGWWRQVDTRPLRAALDRAPTGDMAGRVARVGLLGLLSRFGAEPQFPAWLAADIERAALAAPRAATAAPQPDDDDYLLALTGDILAGQLFPVAGRAGHDGYVGREQTEAAVRNHLRGLGREGMRPWYSSAAIERAITALAHLITLSEDETVAELAAVVLDQVLFALGLNSFQGTFGAAREGDPTATLLSGRMAPTAGISWLLWGLGTLNAHLAAVVSLASGSYDLPPLLAAIATRPSDALWSREQNGAASLAIYKTPDFMLAAALDHNPGQPGRQEHLWQATLGPEAVVFANHPASASLLDVHQANFWRGNAVQPRVAQWHETVIAIHQAPPGAGLDFTHAHFPIHAFDEHALEAGWAFARVGDGYLALTAAAGLTLVTTGDHAYRELRSPGRANVWLCCLGRSALDESFAAFKRGVLAHPPAFDEAAVRWTTPHGSRLAYGWDEPLTVDGRDQPRRGEWRFDNPHSRMRLGADKMDIVHGDQGLRLSFE